MGLRYDKDESKAREMNFILLFIYHCYYYFGFWATRSGAER